MMTPTTQAHELSQIPQNPVTALDQAGGVLGLFSALGVLSLVGLLYQRQRIWLAPMAAALAGLAGVLWIFRSPQRHTPAEDALTIAPCDGEVVAIAEVPESHFLKGSACQITIRLHAGQAQIIRAPLKGTIRYRRYLPASQASQPDDVLIIGIHLRDHDRALLRLSAGPLWRLLPTDAGRRITFLPDLENAVQAGQITGHLPLGGQVDLYLPRAAQVVVTLGQQVRGGETILARL
jgi:phosphatidylserine decarboxylase